MPGRRDVARTLRLLPEAFRTVWRCDPRGVLVVAALQVLTALASLGVVLAGKLLVDAITAADTADGQPSLVLPVLLLAACTAASGSIAVFYNQRLRVMGERVSQSIWSRLLDETSETELITFERIGYVDRLDRIQNEAVSRPFQVVTSLLGAAGSVIGILAMAGVLLGIEPLLVPLLLAAGIPAVLVSRRASRSEFAYSKRVTPGMRRRAYVRLLLSYRPFAAELRSMQSGGRLRELHHEDDDATLLHLRNQVAVRQRYSLLITLTSAVALAATLLVIVAMLRSGRLSLGDAGAAAIATRVLGGQLSSTFGSVGSLIEALPFLRDLDDFLAESKPAGPALPPLPLQRGIALSGVTFTYPGQTEPALRGVDIEIPAGQVVALVGENGSGKTTVAKIVAGLYVPDAGTLAWDGDADVDQLAVQASVTALYQDYVRYQFSVRENIGIGAHARGGSAHTIEESAATAGFAPTAARLPHGYDTVLGKEISDGADLSGGQWQRLALARALHRDAPLIILDEPTASLDARAEHELFGTVKNVLQGRSALIISHRFASVRLADRIYVLQEGRVVESGTHDALVALNGTYAQMFAWQAAAYSSDAPGVPA